MLDRHRFFTLVSDKLKLHHCGTSHSFNTLLCRYQNIFNSVSELGHCFCFPSYFVLIKPELSRCRA